MPRPLRAGALAAAATALLALAAASPALADDPAWNLAITDDLSIPANPPEPDTIKFVPNDPGLTPGVRPAIVVQRAGQTIASAPASGGFVGELSLADLRAGDTITVTDAATSTQLASVVFDGRPSFGTDTCTGKQTFAGAAPVGATVVATQAWVWAKVDSTGTPDDWVATNVVNGKLNPQQGMLFSGNWEKTLAAGSVAGARSEAVVGNVALTQVVMTQTTDCKLPPPGTSTDTGPKSPGQQATSKPALKDEIAPIVTLGRPSSKVVRRLSRRALTTKGVPLSVTSNEISTAVALLSLVPKPGGKVIPLVRLNVPLQAATRTALTLKVPRKKAKYFRHLTGRARMVVHLTITDRVGNTTTPNDVTLRVPRK